MFHNLNEPEARTPAAGGHGGFTLIETTLALALTAVGLIALLGLIPHGLDVMKAASDRSIEARLAQEITGEVMLTDWNKVDSYAGNVRYYDNEGVELEDTTSDELRLNYNVLVEILDTDAKGGFRLPGGGAEPDPDVKRVKISIANIPIRIGTESEFLSLLSDERYKDRVTVYTSTVANMMSEHDLLGSN